MDDEGKLPRRDCSGDALLYTAFPDTLLLTAPHASPSSSPSDAPQTRVPRGAPAKATRSRTSVPYGCCLWQPHTFDGDVFQFPTGKERNVGCAPAHPGYALLHGPRGVSSLAQSSIPGGQPSSLSSALAILSHQPVNKSQTFQ